MLKGILFNRRLLQFVPTSSGLVGYGYHPHNLVAILHQNIKRRNGKLGRTHKNYFHVAFFLRKDTISKPKCSYLAVGCSLSAVRYRLFAIGCSLSAVRYRLSALGCKLKLHHFTLFTLFTLSLSSLFRSLHSLHSFTLSLSSLSSLSFALFTLFTLFTLSLFHSFALFTLFTLSLFRSLHSLRHFVYASIYPTSTRTIE